MSTSNIAQEIWSHELAAATESPVDWLWHGFVAPGNLTLLTSLWKAGKTTLLALLLARRRQGGSVAGFAVKPGKTVVVSEEPQSMWSARARQYDFGDNACFLCRPFLRVPGPQDWQALVDRLAGLQEQHGIDLAVIDPLAPFLPGENNSKNMLDTLLPLGALTRRGMAVLLMHHPAKGEQPVGQAARGSGVLLGHVDIAIEMRHPGGDPLTRRRRFVSLSRHAATPRLLQLELNAEGTDYVAAPDAQQEEFQAHWQVLCMVLEDAHHKLTRQEILDQWPADFDKPTSHTLWRWLSHAVDGKLIASEGKGSKRDPFHYWLPHREEAWKTDPLYELHKLMQEQKRQWNS
jgi:hypothetical protein